MSECYTCKMCRVYVWDVLHAPFPSEHIYYGFYNLKSVQKILPELVPEFHRIASDHYYDVFDIPDLRRSMYINTRAIESGLVRRTGISYHGCFSRGKPLEMASRWTNHYFKQLKNLQEIHRDHSGIFKEAPMPPIPLQAIIKYLDAGHISPDKMEMYLEEHDLYSS